MTFKPTVVPQPNNTFERAFQYGQNLILQDRAERRAQAEHEALMADREQQTADRDMNMQIEMLKLGAKPLPEGATAADTGLARILQEQGANEVPRISKPQFGRRMQMRESGATQEGLPTFSMDSYMQREEGPSEPIIPPGTPAMPEDVQTIGSGDRRYAVSQLMNERLAREATEREESRITPEQRGLIAAYTQRSPEKVEGLDDWGVLAQIALDQFNQRYTDDPTVDRTAIRQRDAAIREMVQNGLDDMGVNESNTPPENLQEIRRRLTLQAQEEYDSSTDARGTSAAPNFEGQSVEDIAAGDAKVPETRIAEWYTEVKNNTESLDEIQAAIRNQTRGNRAALRLLHRDLTRLINEEWEIHGWGSPKNRPGRGFNLQKSVFDAANTPEEMADVIVGETIR